MDSSLRIIICLLKIPTTNATRVSLRHKCHIISLFKFWALMCNIFFMFHHLSESSGAFLQASELRYSVWHIQSLVPCRTLWTVLQSLQQGNLVCACMLLAKHTKWWSLERVKLIYSIENVELLFAGLSLIAFQVLQLLPSLSQKCGHVSQMIK